jgi:hypothetical protein
MKRTKSMIYKPSEEARELLLVATNESKLYTSMIVPTVRNLAKKYNKGKFDADKAIDAFWYVADAASKQYHKEYGYLFTVTERFTAAKDMVDYYMDDIIANDL